MKTGAFRFVYLKALTVTSRWSVICLVTSNYVYLGLWSLFAFTAVPNEIRSKKINNKNKKML